MVFIKGEQTIAQLENLVVFLKTQTILSFFHSFENLDNIDIILLKRQVRYYFGTIFEAFLARFPLEKQNVYSIEYFHRANLTNLPIETGFSLFHFDFRRDFWGFFFNVLVIHYYLK